ncbi:GA4 desaturase [Colletotrichum sublineola]|nr:GA4 desaturase [Colletotrichum sublineola]
MSDQHFSPLNETKDSRPSRPGRQIIGAFTYYNSPDMPTLNDLSIIEGTSSDNKTYFLPVTNLRSLPAPLSSYTHEKHGFQILHQDLPFTPSPEVVHNQKIMATQYYPSMTALLKKALGARCAIVRKHSLRDIPDWAAIGMNPEIGFEIESLAPFSIAHSDYTPAGARGHFRAMKEPDWFLENNHEDGCTTAAEREEFFRLRREIIDAEDYAIAKAGINPEVQVGENGEKPRGGHWDWDGRNYDGPRYAFFSIWRAWETVKRDPLAVMDMSQPVSQRIEYAPLTRTYQDRPGCVPFYYSQNALIRPLGRVRRDSGYAGDSDSDVGSNPAWCYLSEQTPEEVYLLKFYDSEALVRKGKGIDEIQIMCPHSAFQIAGQEMEPVRRSCELRVWCIW